MGQLNMGKETERSPAEVIDQAIAFFGPGGVGLDLVQHTADTASFTGGGGLVQVTVTPQSNGRHTEVNVVTRDWEFDVKQFMVSI